MDTSQYSQPAQSNIVNTYSPIPFQEMMQAGMMKQKEQEQGLNQLYSTADNVSNIKYIPNSVDEQYVKQHVVPKAQEIVSKYASQDLTDPVIRRQMMSEFNTNIDKNRIKTIQDSAEGYKQYQAGRQHLQLEDKLGARDVDVSQGWDSSQHGTFNAMPTPYSDPIATLRKNLFEPLHDSTTSTWADKLGNYHIVSGVDKKAVEKVIQTNLPEYLKRKEGQTAIADYRQSTGITPDQMDDVQVLTKVMRGAAEPYIRANEKVDRLAVEDASSKQVAGADPFNAENKMQFIGNQALKSATLDIGIDPRNVKTPEDVKNVDAHGNLIAPTAPEQIKLNQGKFGLPGRQQNAYLPQGSIEATDKQAQEKYKQDMAVYNHQRSIIDGIKKNTPGLENATDQMAIHAYSAAYNKAKTIAPNEYLYKNLPGAQNIAKFTTEQVIKTLGSRNLINAQTGKKSGTQVNDYKDLMKSLNVPTKEQTLEDGIPKNMSITGVVPSMGAYKATIWTTDGPKDFLISFNANEQRHFDLVQKATEIANNGGFGDKQIPNSNFAVRTRIVKGQDNSPEFAHDIYNTETGEAIGITKLERAALQNFINPTE